MEGLLFLALELHRDYRFLEMNKALPLFSRLSMDLEASSYLFTSKGPMSICPMSPMGMFLGQNTATGSLCENFQLFFDRMTLGVLLIQQRTDPHQPEMGKGITFVDTQGHHGSHKCLPPSVTVWRQQVPGINEKEKNRLVVLSKNSF